MNREQTFICTVSGPSWAGKSTLLKNLMSDGFYNQMENWTTRPSRWADDTDYRFCSDGEFENMRESGEFISLRETKEGKYGLRGPSDNATNLAIVDPNGVKMIRDYCASQTKRIIKTIHFLLDVPKQVCLERIHESGWDALNKRIIRLESEFWIDGKFQTKPLIHSSFLILDGLSSVEDIKKMTVSHLEKILLNREENV